MRNRQTSSHRPVWESGEALTGLLDRFARQPLQGIGQHEGSEVCQHGVVCWLHVVTHGRDGCGGSDQHYMCVTRMVDGVVVDLAQL